MKRCGIAVAVFAWATLFIGRAGADSLSIDGTWHAQFELMQAPGEYFATTYAATQTEAVEITGYWDNTDQYTVFVNGDLKLITPAIGGAPIDYGDGGFYTDPGSAWGSGLFTEGILNVNAGDVISFQDVGPLFFDAFWTNQNGVNEYDAQVGVQAVAPITATVPEPCTLLLFTTSAGIFLIGRRRAGRSL